MKKNIAQKMTIILILLHMSVVAFARGSSDSSAKLVLAIWGGDSDVSAFNSMLAAASDKLEGIKTELLLLADYDTSVTTRIVGGQQIDGMVIAESVHQFSTRNQLLALNDWIAKMNVDMQQRFGANKDLYARNGQIYALPLRAGPMLIYANTDLLTQKPQIDWSFEQLMKAAVAAYKAGATAAQTTWGFATNGDGTWWPWYTSFIYSAGGSILDEQGRPNFDDPATIQGLKNYASFIHDTGVAPSLKDMADIGQNSPDPLFNSGRAAMITTGWWNVRSLQAADFGWDIAPIPNADGKGTVLFGQGLAITAVSKYPKQTFQLIEALTDKPAQEAIVRSRWDIPANLEVLQSDTFLRAPWSANSLDMAAVATAISEGAINLPYSQDWNQMHDIISNVVNELLAGNTDATAAAARIQEELLQRLF